MPGNRAAATVSLCMIVRDEAVSLPVCLASAAAVVDEIVVVDTGSTDDTPAIAAANGARVVRIPWMNDFAGARNAGLELATEEWILWLDADEELPLETQQQLKATLRTTNAAALRVCVRSFLPPSDLQPYEDTTMVRLFRNQPEHRFRYPIHEQIRPSVERAGGTIANSGLVFWHYGYMQKATSPGNARAERNLGLLRQMLPLAPHDPYVHFQLGVSYKALGQLALAEHHLTAALELDHGALSSEVHVRLLTRLSQLALSGERYEEALDWSELALVEQPHNVAAHYVAGVAGAYLGQARAANHHFYEVRYHCPSDPKDYPELDALLAYFAQPDASLTLPAA